jgi:hypothetical protein
MRRSALGAFLAAVENARQDLLETNLVLNRWRPM